MDQQNAATMVEQIGVCERIFEYCVGCYEKYIREVNLQEDLADFK